MMVVNCNPLYTPRELEHQLNDSGAEAIVILENFAKTLEQVIAKTKVKTVVTTQLGDMLGFPKSLITNFVVKHVKKMVPAWNLPGTIAFPTALVGGRAARRSRSRRSRHDDLAFLQYTGGTTGVSKGAMLTHGNIVSNLLQTSAWWGAGLREGEEIIITALPLYHIFALTGNCLTFMKIGGAQRPHHQPARHARLRRRSSRKYRFTCITGVNTLFNALLNTPGLRRARLLAPEACRWAAAWRCSARWPSAGSR